MAWSADAPDAGRKVGRSAWVASLLAIPLLALLHGAPALEKPPQIDATGAAEAPAPIDLRQTRLRVRVTAIDPAEAVKVQWRQGGEGLGGTPRRGAFRGKSGNDELKLGEWSESIVLDEMLPPDILHDTYLTVFAGRRTQPKKKASARRPYSRNAVFEVEHAAGDKILRRFVAHSPEGATVSLAVPGTRRDGFVDRLSTVAEVASRRRQLLLRLPWAKGPLPKLYPVVSDLGGFGEAWGYGVRVSDRSIVNTELDSLKQLGVTGLRTAPDFIAQAGPTPGNKWRVRIVGPAGYPVPRIAKRRDTEHEAGCPFGPRIKERQREILDRVLQRAGAANASEVWALTVDEIGAVTDRADNGKQHLTTCERCRRGFVDYLKGKHLRPPDVGAKTWDEVRPLSIWKSQTKEWTGQRGLSRRAFHTREFLNVASASLFTPLRDALAAHNASANASTPKIYSYALRGNNFLSNGSSLDYFEFYRHADNAMVWETSNRDARAWPWDSYLCDVQRVLKRELGIEGGIYVKPHRGAPVQRMLSAVSRGDSLLYWYTYGPDYWKGDAFSTQPKALELTSKAAHLLGRAEPFLYGARPDGRPRVAIVRPETTWAWMSLAKSNAAQAAALENGKWIYTALQHAHVPVDPLDERFLTELNLSGYAAIFVNGTHITAAAARALEGYVRAGGTLISSGFGLARDESDAVLTSLFPVFGLASRGNAEMWCTVPMYRAGQLGLLTQLPASDPPVPCTVRDSIRSAQSLAELPLMVGREVLRPISESDVVARFRDNAPAVVRHRYGAGVAWLMGAFVGVEYAEPVMHAAFDMRRDFRAERRGWITTALPTSGLAPVSCSDPLVEAVLLRSANGRGHALTLANWAYRDQASHAGAVGLVKFVALVETSDLRVVVHSLKTARRVRSTSLAMDLPFEVTPDGVSFILPKLAEGDVITLE